MARIKDEVEQIVGRRIVGVVIKHRDKPEAAVTSQLFLLFEDGSYYEFYTYNCSVSTTGGVVQGGLNEVLAYMGDTLKPVFVKYQG